VQENSLPVAKEAGGGGDAGKSSWMSPGVLEQSYGGAQCERSDQDTGSTAANPLAARSMSRGPGLPAQPGARTNRSPVVA